MQVGRHSVNFFKKVLDSFAPNTYRAVHLPFSAVVLLSSCGLWSLISDICYLHLFKSSPVEQENLSQRCNESICSSGYKSVVMQFAYFLLDAQGQPRQLPHSCTDFRAFSLSSLSRLSNFQISRLRDTLQSILRYKVFPDTKYPPIQRSKQSPVKR